MHTRSGRKEEALGADGQPISQLGMAVRAWRRHCALSVTQLADRAGFGPTGRAYISKIEHGYIKKLGGARLRHIAEALGISASDLLSHRLPPDADGLLQEPEQRSAQGPRAPQPTARAPQPTARARRPDRGAGLAADGRDLAAGIAEATLEMGIENPSMDPALFASLIGKLERHLTPRLADAVRAAIEAAAREARERLEVTPRASQSGLPSAGYPEEGEQQLLGDQTQSEGEQAVAWVNQFLREQRDERETHTGERVPHQHAEHAARQVGAHVVSHEVLRRIRPLLDSATSTAPVDVVQTPPRVSAGERSALRQATQAAMRFLREIGAPPPRALRAVEPASPRASAHTIFLVFQGPTDSRDEMSDLHEAWCAALQDALRRGWTIVHLLHRRQDRARALALMDLVIELLGTGQGRYEPLYMRQRTPAQPAHDFIVVPAKGALELLPSSGAGVTPRVILRAEAPDRCLELAHAARQLEADGIRLIHAFPRNGQFSAVIAATEGQSGDRSLVMAGLSEVTVPMYIFRERATEVARRDAEKVDEIEQLIQAHEQRERNFRQHVRHAHVRDLCPMSAIERYVESGIYSPDDRLLALGAPPLTPGQRAHHLGSLIRRLDSHPRYELGLLDDASVAGEHLFHVGPGSDQTYWMVKQGHTLLMETLHTLPNGQVIEMDVAISEPVIVSAFHNYFVNHLWNQPSVTHDRDVVIHWLQRQMARIPAA